MTANTSDSLAAGAGDGELAARGELYGALSIQGAARIEV